MQQLESLTREAVALANGSRTVIPILSNSEAEVGRQMQICNACRYCEGFCAVFPAMTRRLEFGKADIHFLANLCHNCGACLHACQYALPHEFAVNVPQAMARVRAAVAVLPAVTLAGFASLTIAPSASLLVVVQVVRRAAEFAIVKPAREVGHRHDQSP